MSRVFLLRHARAGWPTPGMRDFDRPLEQAGRRDAESIGRAMADAGFLPDRVLCSTAVRTRETLSMVSLALSLATAPIGYSDILYNSDAAGYLAMIRGAADCEALMIVGHNPMIEDIAMALAGDGDARAKADLATGFPTSGLAAIRFDGALSEIARGGGYLEAFLAP